MKRLLAGSAVCGLLLAISAVSAHQAARTNPPKPTASPTPLVAAVEGIGLTVRDAERSAEFFKTVLDFEPVSDVEVTGAEHDRWTGVFGVRLRVLTLKIGSEVIELTEFLTPREREYPADTRSNDRWF